MIVFNIYNISREILKIRIKINCPLFGTFSLPILGNTRPLLIFIVCIIIGSAFEYFVSWFMEIAFGATAWDYSDQFLGDLFGGRTCLLYASMFGFLGTVWIKLLLPIFLKVFNLIPWKWRYGVTAVCATLMLFNCVMTLQALDNWGARKAGHVPAPGIEQFYAADLPPGKPGGFRDRFSLVPCRTPCRNKDLHLTDYPSLNAESHWNLRAKPTIANICDTLRHVPAR